MLVLNCFNYAFKALSSSTRCFVVTFLKTKSFFSVAGEVTMMVHCFLVFL